jgi:signal peptidase II
VAVPRKYAILVALTLGVIVLDQWTKYLVVRDLTTRFDNATTLSARLGAFYSPAEVPPARGLHFQPRTHVEVVEGFFRLRYAENPGAAWGMFRDLPPGMRGVLFNLVSLGAVLLIVFYFRKLSGTDPKEAWALWGLPLVLGGALGNYIDRVARAFVIDFLEAHWHDKAAWPSFNIADAAICIGVGMLVVDAFVRKEKPAAAPAKA